jgi:hypothetical protein
MPKKTFFKWDTQKLRAYATGARYFFFRYVGTITRWKKRFKKHLKMTQLGLKHVVQIKCEKNLIVLLLVLPIW